MTDTVTEPDPRKGQRLLVILFAIAFVPLFVAYGVFFLAPGLMPSTTTNAGNLIVPPVETGIQQDKWTLFVGIPATCEETCQQVLYETRQIHVALGKESPRIQRTLVIERPASDDVMNFIRAEHQAADLIVDPVLFGQLKSISGTPATVFLMDPLGNIMMYYLPGKGGKPMLKDIKHLLKISNIG